MTAERNPQPQSFFARIINWLPRNDQPLPDATQVELEQARKDIDRLQDDLDDMAAAIESKNRQLLASAEALARANGDTARQRRLANQLQQTLDNERRLFKHQSTELTDARKNRKRR